MLDAELTPFAGIRYSANVGDPEINRGIAPDDGFITLDVPAGVESVVVSMHLSDNENDAPLEWKFDVRDDLFDDSAGHKVQRLINLGFADELLEGEDSTDASRIALARYRSCVENHKDSDDEVFANVASKHEGSAVGDDRSRSAGGVPDRRPDPPRKAAS